MNFVGPPRLADGRDIPIDIRGRGCTPRGAWDRSGSRGMGRWAGRSLSRSCVPTQSDNSTICSRFLYEAKITAQLEHPGIVPVYELGGGPVPFYTMRFVKGRTLSEATRSYHKDRLAGTADSLGLVKLLSAFLGVCHAIAYAHSRGVIHRDLKGQNVILGDFGEVIVLDWGIAKQIGPATAGHPGRVATSSTRSALGRSRRRLTRRARWRQNTLNPDAPCQQATGDSDASAHAAQIGLGGWS